MISRRQRRQYIFAGMLAVTAVVNVLFYFILNRPAETNYRRLQQSIEQLQTHVQESQKRLAALENTNTQVDQFDQDRRNLLTQHFLPRDTGYSRILTQLDEIVRRTGVKETRITLPLEETQFGLNAVRITLPVEGGYSNVVNFIRELEKSDIFLLISSIAVAPSADATQPGAASTIALSLVMETFFYK